MDSLDLALLTSQSPTDSPCRGTERAKKEKIIVKRFLKLRLGWEVGGMERRGNESAYDSTK